MGESTGPEDSGTNEGGRPEVMPIDMGFGHFMMNMQTGVICWCPSGTLQPDGSPDWVVVSDPLTSAGTGQDCTGDEDGHHGNENGWLTATEEGASSMAIGNNANSPIADREMVIEEEGTTNENGLAAESIMGGNMDLYAETDSAYSQ